MRAIADIAQFCSEHSQKSTSMAMPAQRLERTRQTLFGARSLDIHLVSLALGRSANRNIEYTLTLPEKGEECSHLEQSVLKESRGL